MYACLCLSVHVCEHQKVCAYVHAALYAHAYMCIHAHAHVCGQVLQSHVYNALMLLRESAAYVFLILKNRGSTLQIPTIAPRHLARR